MFDNLQSIIINRNSFIYKLDFYSTTIVKMLEEENCSEKVYAQLMNCLDRLEILNEDLYKRIIDYVKKKKRSIVVYQAFFNLIEKKDYLESIYSIIETLLFQETDQLLQWDNQDCILHFLIQLIKKGQNSFMVY